MRVVGSKPRGSVLVRSARGGECRHQFSSRYRPPNEAVLILILFLLLVIILLYFT